MAAINRLKHNYVYFANTMRRHVSLLSNTTFLTQPGQDSTVFNNADFLKLESCMREVSFFFMKFSGKSWFLNSSYIIFMLNQ